MDYEKRVNMKALEKILEDKGLGFCSDELLMEKMKLEPGVVSLFGLINNEDKDIKIIFDEDVINEEIFTFHANVNTITVFLSVYLNKKKIWYIIYLMPYTETKDRYTVQRRKDERRNCNNGWNNVETYTNEF